MRHLLFALSLFQLWNPTLVAAQTIAGVRVRVDVLKRASQQKSLGGPALVGPQRALELEWRVLNETGDTLELPAPGSVLRLRVRALEREVAVRTEWAPEMQVRFTTNGQLVAITRAPLGAIVLPDGASVCGCAARPRESMEPALPQGTMNWNSTPGVFNRLPLKMDAALCMSIADSLFTSSLWN